MNITINFWEFPGGLEVKTFIAVAQVQSLVWALKSLTKLLRAEEKKEKEKEKRKKKERKEKAKTM